MGCERKVNPKLVLRPGDLRHRITIQQRVSTPQRGGGQSITHTDVATVWASIEPMRGQEIFVDGGLRTIQRIKARMRYLPGITTTHRIVRADGVIMDIREALDIELRHAVLELTCEEGDGDA